MRRQIGTVELLLDRVYARTAGQDPSDPDAELVYVEAGMWPVYRDGDKIYWEMSGVLSRRRVAVCDLGDGAFGVSANDEPSGNEVIFTSRKFTPGEFIDFVHNDPIVVGGRRERRLIFNLVM